MAKNGNGTTWKISLMILIAGFGITIAAIVWDASHKSSDIDANRKDIDIVIPKVENNKEACQEFRYKIDTLTSKVNEINEEQKNIRREQQNGFNAILDRLPD